MATAGIIHTTHDSFLREPGGRIHFVLQDEVPTMSGAPTFDTGKKEKNRKGENL